MSYKTIDAVVTVKDCEGEIFCQYMTKLFADDYSLSDFPIVRDFDVDGEIWHRKLELVLEEGCHV